MLVIRDEKQNATNHNNRKKGYFEHNENINHYKLTNNKNYVKLNTKRIEQDINQHYQNQIEEYNNKQKRQSYKVDNYFQEKKVIKNQRELLIALNTKEEYINVELYEQFYKNVYEYLKTKKDMYLTNVVVHNDEHRPHMHVNWILLNKARGRIQSWTTFNTWKNQNTEEI